VYRSLLSLKDVEQSDFTVHRDAEWPSDRDPSGIDIGGSARWRGSVAVVLSVRVRGRSDRSEEPHPAAGQEDVRS